MKKLKTPFLLVLLMIIGALVVFTACNGNKVTLSFETNGGEQIANVSWDKGEEYTLPEPTREGYSFDGWYLNGDFTGDSVTKYTPDKDTTFYAKWSQYYTLTLVANGGTLSTTTIRFKAGDKLSTLLNGVTVTPPTDHQFGAWFNGNNEVNPEDALAASDLTLTAKFKVKYTIHNYIKDDEGDGFTLIDDTTGYDYAGTTPAVAKEGYTLLTDNENYNVKALSDNASENVFNAYYDRQAAKVTLNSNYPGQVSQEQKEIDTKFGLKIKLPTDFAAEGYVLAGWSKDGSSNMVCASSFMYDRLYNQADATAPEDYAVDGVNVTLYGVWVKGNVDLLGGNDLIYHFSNDDENIYLCRGGKYFCGRYIKGDSTFVFSPSLTNVIEGKLIGDGTFIYADYSRANTKYTLYGNTLVTLTMDAYNGVTYSETDPDSGLISNSTGTYELDESTGNVLYIVTFDEVGPVAGEEFTILLNGNYFYIRNDEELKYGVMPRYVDEYRYYSAAYQMRFTGYGTVQYNSGSGTSVFTYEKDINYTGVGEKFTLMNSLGNVAGEILVVLKGTNPDTQAGIYGYYLIDDTYNHTYESEDGTEFLTLDGIYTASYLGKDGRTIKGTYSFSSTRFDDYDCIIMTVPKGDPTDFQNVDTYRFFIKTITNTVEDGEETATEYEYVMESKLSSYAELIYMNDAGKGYKVPLITLDETEKGKMSIYGFDSSNKYIKIATANYVIDEDTGLATATDIVTIEAFKDSTYLWNMEEDLNIELDKIQSFIFGIASSSSANYYYLYSVTPKDGKPTKYDKIYTGSNDSKLTLISVFAFYEYKNEEGATVSLFGSYSRSENVITFSASSGTFRFEVTENEGNNTFIVLDKFYGTVYGIDGDGKTDKTQKLVFDGKGGVTYTAGETEYQGTYDVDGESETDYVFTQNDDGEFTMKFRLYSTSSSVIFVVYNKEMDKTYESVDGSFTLKLDGYANAVYTPTDGEPYEGIYFFNEEGEYVTMTIDGATRYFDLTKEGKFTLRGVEYFNYVYWYDNQTVRLDIYFALDGYGKLTVYNGQDEVIDEHGTYRTDDDMHFTFEFTKDDKPMVLYGALGTVSISSSQRIIALLVEHENLVGSYVNTSDWTIMTLDSIGNVTIQNNRGGQDSGVYRIIETTKEGSPDTKNIIYCTFSGSGNMYFVDTSTGVVVPQKFDAYGYYTESFEALNFSEYGYGYMEGELIYYIVEDNQNVTIFRTAKEGEEANEYGYTKLTDFGTFNDLEKNYNNKHYYRASGYSLTFARETTTATQYPVTIEMDSEGKPVKAPLRELSFTPINNGDKPGEFSVTGRVYVKEQTRAYTCTVVRNVLDDGIVEFYILVGAGNGGYFRFDIELTYKGEESVGTNNYKVNSLKLVRQYESYTYLNNYFFAYYLFGMQIPNTVGTISIVNNYDAEGNDLGSKLSAEFGANSNMRYYNGDFVKIENADVTSTGTGLFEVELKNESDESDEQTYVLRFYVQAHQYLGTYGFVIYSFTYKQTFIEDEYKIEVERIITSESGGAAGAVLSISLYKKTDGAEAEDGYELLPLDIGVIKGDGTIIYAVRVRNEEDESKPITSTTYYYITLVEHVNTEVDASSADVTDEDTADDADSGESEEPQEPVFKPVEYYESAKVEEKSMTTRYNVDGDSFADIDEETHKIELFCIKGGYYLASECEYTEGTKTYKVTTTAGTVYEIVEDDNGKITITKVGQEKD